MPFISRCQRPERCSSLTAVPVHLEPVGCRLGSPVRAPPVTGFRTPHSSSANSAARPSGAVRRTSATGSVSTLGTPCFTPYGSGAADDDADRRRAHLVRASVFNALPCANLPTTARLVASGDIARSRPLPRCARRRRRSPPRRWRWLRITIVAGDAVHVHDAADHRGNAVLRSGDDDGSQPVGDHDHGAAAPLPRPLHVEPVDCVASRPDSLPSPVCGLARLAAFGDVAHAHAVRLATLVFGVAPPRSRRPVRASPSPASALRHPVLSIPLSAPLHEPPAACSARLPSASSALPPLSRRGGSRQRASPASIPPRSYPEFVVLDRVPRLWFSHPTHR